MVLRPKKVIVKDWDGTINWFTVEDLNLRDLRKIFYITQKIIKKD